MDRKELIKDYTVAHYVEHGEPYWVIDCANDIGLSYTGLVQWLEINDVPGVVRVMKHNPKTAPQRHRRSLALLPSRSALREFIHSECRPKHGEDF